MARFDTEYYKGTDQYSDGDIEDRILEIVRAGKSPDEAGDRSFPVLYHLSHIRENILCWYPFRENASVLEIGAGPGAITGLLSRKCGSVTSVDLSHRRSTINYERHRDCGNLTVMAGNLNDMEFPEPFDYVVLNGVFEYAGSFTDGPDPYGTFLKRCLSYLKEDGTILIAIENRLGLKYFAGAPEDHTDNYMEGLKDYPGNSDVHTFSRQEWEELLKRCGLSSGRFYYPWPDYKFPNEIFTDASLSADGFARNAWNFNPRRLELFSERQMAASLCREGVMDRFMNSFLIEASIKDTGTGTEEEKIIYAKLSADRDKRFRIGTVICEREGVRKVVKSPLTEEAAMHLKKMHETEQSAGSAVLPLGGEEYTISLLKGELREDGSCEYPYLSGRNLGREAAEAADRKDTNAVREMTAFLWDLILENRFAPGKTGGEFAGVFGPAGDEREWEMVCPANIDLILDNIFLQESGRGRSAAQIIDAEWVFYFPVPAQFILWRAVNELYNGCSSLKETLPEEELLKEYGIGPAERQLFWKWADRFEKEYVGANRLAAWAQPVRKADLKDLQWSGEDVRLTATLYLDLGRGYNEEDAIHTDIVLSGGRYEVTFEITGPEKIRSMRFDPLEGTACICDLTSPDVELKPVNASARCRGGYEFLTMDPAYRVKFKAGKSAAEKTTDGGQEDSGQVRTIRISGRVETRDVYWALAKSQELLRRSRRGPLGEAASAIKKITGLRD